MARWPIFCNLSSSECVNESISSCLLASSGRSTAGDGEDSTVAENDRSLKLSASLWWALEASLRRSASLRRADASAGVTPIAAAASCRGPNASTLGGVVRRRRDASESREGGSFDSGLSSCFTVSDSPALSAWPQLAGGNLLPGVCGRGLGTGTVRLRFSGFGGGRRGGGDDIGRSPSRSSGRQVTAVGALAEGLCWSRRALQPSGCIEKNAVVSNGGSLRFQGSPIIHPDYAMVAP